VFTGGGLGGLLVATDWIGELRPYDLFAGLYPFVETVANPHFVVGTTLLAAALGAFAADRPALGIVLGSLLALVRPYDAALVAVTTLRIRGDDDARRHRLYLALWATLALLMVVVRPVSFALQFLAGVGVPLLTLAAIGLGRMRRRLLELAVPVFATTAVVVTWLQSSPNAYRDVPVDRWRVAAELRRVCRPGEVVLAPPDIGLYVGGLSACWPWVSHSASPEHETRDSATRRFYAATSGERRRFLDEACVSHVVVPGDWPNSGLPPEAPYRLRLEVDGPGGGLAVYSRTAGSGSGCPSTAP
jgi:hypothetical protein